MDQPSVVFGFQEGWNHLWERYPRFEEVLPRLHQLRSAVFGGASAIKTTPISTRTATPISSPRATMLRHAWVPMRAACAKLDHAVKAITLRLADGLRMAKSRKTPSVTYRLIIMESAGSCRINTTMGEPKAIKSNPTPASTIFNANSRFMCHLRTTAS